MFTNISLTRYRPNFCAECGAKLLRLHWHFWTSRRFCNECARRLRKARLGPAVMIILTLFGAGFIVGRIRRPPVIPLIIQRRSDSPLSDGAPNGGTPTRVNSSPTHAALAEVTTVDVYTCGARTKKGTPCSRRVHGPVRCWQHKGMSAMLPQERLRVKDLAP
jgi:hypothetical protein